MFVVEEIPKELAHDPRMLAVYAPESPVAVVCGFSPDEGRWRAITAVSVVDGEPRPLPPCFDDALVAEACEQFDAAQP